nr:6631_t:CDS:2 [Entrophospora candida]
MTSIDIIVILVTLFLALPDEWSGLDSSWCHGFLKEAERHNTKDLATLKVNVASFFYLTKGALD